MIPGPAIAVVDDDSDHLKKLVGCLNNMGYAALPVLFAEGKAQIRQPLSSIQILFMDIHLIPAVPVGPQAFDIVSQALEAVIASDNGPYILITWSTHPDQHGALMEHLAEEGNVATSVPVPLASARLDKNQYLGRPDDLTKLEQDIRDVVGQIPQINAIMGWSNAARIAAGEVAHSLMNLLPRADRFRGQVGERLEQLMTAIAREGAGGNAAADLTAAMNEGLAPILVDRLLHATAANRQLSEDNWQAAISKPSVPPGLENQDKAALNTMNTISVHDIENIAAGSRGAVCELPENFPDGRDFLTVFGAASEVIFDEYLTLMSEEHRAAGNMTKPQKRELRAETLAACSFRLIGVSAICDFAWGRVPVKKLLLGLEVPTAVFENFQPRDHGAKYVTPTFVLQDPAAAQCLVMNWHYTSTATGDLGVPTLYRLREPTISHMINDYHVYGFRPGRPDYTD